MAAGGLDKMSEQQKAEFDMLNAYAATAEVRALKEAGTATKENLQAIANKYFEGDMKTMRGRIRTVGATVSQEQREKVEQIRAQVMETSERTIKSMQVGGVVETGPGGELRLSADIMGKVGDKYSKKRIAQAQEAVAGATTTEQRKALEAQLMSDPELRAQYEERARAMGLEGEVVAGTGKGFARGKGGVYERGVGAKYSLQQLVGMGTTRVSEEEKKIATGTAVKENAKTRYLQALVAAEPAGAAGNLEEYARLQRENLERRHDLSSKDIKSLLGDLKGVGGAWGAHTRQQLRDVQRQRREAGKLGRGAKGIAKGLKGLGVTFTEDEVSDLKGKDEFDIAQQVAAKLGLDPDELSVGGGDSTEAGKLVQEYVSAVRGGDKDAIAKAQAAMSRNPDIAANIAEEKKKRIEAGAEAQAEKDPLAAKMAASLEEIKGALSKPLNVNVQGTVKTTTSKGGEAGGQEEPG